jgi:hypothetical protein
VYHLLAAAGIWSLHLELGAGGAGLTSLAGTALISGGYVVLSAVPAMLLRGDAASPAEVMAAVPVLKLFGLLSALGIVLFAVACMRASRFPTWTPIVFVLGSFVTLAALAAGAPVIVAIFGNVAASLALLRMAWQAYWRSAHA